MRTGRSSGWILTTPLGRRLVPSAGGLSAGNIKIDIVVAQQLATEEAVHSRYISDRKALLKVSGAQLDVSEDIGVAESAGDTCQLADR